VVGRGGNSRKAGRGLKQRVVRQGIFTFGGSMGNSRGSGLGGGGGEGKGETDASVGKAAV